MSVTTARALFKTNLLYYHIFLYITRKHRLHMHKRSGGKAPSAGRFLRFFNKNDVPSDMFGLKFELQA